MSHGDSIVARQRVLADHAAVPFDRDNDFVQ